MNAGEACNREVVIVDRDESIVEAARLMRRFHVGDLVVVRDKKTSRTPVGILTDRDIVVKVLARDIDPETVSIGDAMSFELVTVRVDEGLTETIDKMRSYGVRRIPVVNLNGGLEGILTVDDCMELVAEQVCGLVELIKTEQRREKRERA